MANIPIDRLADELVQAVKEYTDDVAEGVRKTVDKTAREVLKEAQALAPKRTGEYAKTFTITKDDRPIVTGKGYEKDIYWFDGVGFDWLRFNDNRIEHESGG